MAKRKRRRLWRVAAGVAIAAPIAVLALWFAVHRYPWLGPKIADGLRAVFGTSAVERLERFAYGVEDRVNRWRHGGEPPKERWEAPPPASASIASSNTKDAATDAPPPPRRPDDLKPMHERVATPADGRWIAVATPSGTSQGRDPQRHQSDHLMHKTLLHPDKSRPWAELFVVAFDLERIDLHFVPGTREPKANATGGRELQRSGLIAGSDRHTLLVAFNGGFKTEHGHYGMGIGGKRVVLPRPHSCTVAKTKSGDLTIDTWTALEAREAEFVWWRQTPPCVYEDGKMHPSLWDPETRGWGAALGGETVIRRSAIALDEERRFLFVGVSNHTTAKALADGMHHAGGHDVAQLDVNWSFPKLVVFERGPDGLEPKSLFEGFEVEKGEFVREPSPRDFFYVTAAGVSAKDR